MKVLVNRCYGGFSVSEKTVLLYAKLKGITVYPEVDYGYTVYWTVPEEARAPYLESSAWLASTVEARKASNLFYEENTIGIYFGHKERVDPIWIAVVEELGKEANGTYADLRVVEIPDDVDWEIEGYDGYETIREVSRTW